VDLRRANALITRGRDRIVALEAQNCELRDNIQASAAGHTEAIAELSATNAQTATELQNVTEDAENLEKEINGLRTEKQMFMAESQTRGCKNEQPVAEINDIQACVASLRAENIRLQQDNKSILQENVGVRVEFERGRARNIEDGIDHIAGRWVDGGESSGQGMSRDATSENKYLFTPAGDSKFPNYPPLRV
jgi:chromosome segregation ATPase